MSDAERRAEEQRRIAVARGAVMPDSPRGSHGCPAPGCGATVEASRFACGPHYLALSDDLRSRIREFYIRVANDALVTETRRLELLHEALIEWRGGRPRPIIVQ